MSKEKDDKLETEKKQSTGYPLGAACLMCRGHSPSATPVATNQNQV